MRFSGAGSPFFATDQNARRWQICTADQDVEAFQRWKLELFDAVSKDLPFNSGDEVGLMINGLGGTPPSELYVLYRRAALRCKDAGLKIVRNYVGEYCTSLEMAGFSMTLIRLDGELARRGRRGDDGLPLHLPGSRGRRSTG